MADEGRLKGDIGPQVSSREITARIAGLAGRRHRVVSHAQLLGLGLSAEAIKCRSADGRLVRRFRGVYVVGPGPLTRPGELLAAALFVGPDGFVSCFPAAGMLGVSETAGGRTVDVTCPRRIAAPRGIRTHRSVLARDERTVWKDVPVTSTGRTILDCAASTSPREIERMLTRAFMLRLPVKPALAVLLERYPGWRGSRVARAALERFEGGARLTKSELEDRYLDFIDRHGLPRPLTNHRVKTGVGTILVDCCWPAERLAIEIDAPSTHGARPTMLSDRRRDRAATLAGWTPGRVMEEDLEDEDALAAELRALLGVARSRRGA